MARVKEKYDRYKAEQRFTRVRNFTRRALGPQRLPGGPAKPRQRLPPPERDDGFVTVTLDTDAARFGQRK